MILVVRKVVTRFITICFRLGTTLSWPMLKCKIVPLFHCRFVVRTNTSYTNRQWTLIHQTMLKTKRHYLTDWISSSITHQSQLVWKKLRLFWSIFRDWWTTIYNNMLIKMHKLPLNSFEINYEMFVVLMNYLLKPLTCRW